MKNQSIHVGLIGLGSIGKVHAQGYEAIPRCFRKSKVQAQVCAILRSKTGGEDEMLAKLGNPLETTDAEEFLGQNLDMVDICTPNYLHAQQINMALEEGLNIYCEKPLANNLEEARQIVEAAKKAGVLTHTAFVMRYYPAVQQAKAIMASGFLGEIYTFRGYLYHNSYMNPQRALTWRMQKATSGGGAMADLGIHYIDLVRYLLGDARWVQCHTRTLIQKRPKTTGSSEMATVDVDDWGMCILELENGAYGSIEAHRMSGGIRDNNRMQIFGSKGSLEIDLNHPDDVILYNFENKPVKFSKKDFPLAPEQRPLEDVFPPKPTSMGYFIDTHLASIMDFMLSIQENKPSGLNFENALKAQEILEAAYRSADHNGEMVKLPLA